MDTLRSRRGGGRLLIAFAAMVAAIAAASFTEAGASGAGTLTVRSTLTGKTTLPHRVRWLGIPNLPESKIREVDFLIDGKLTWVEHHAPYTFAYDGNYLVTTWLHPGEHTFTVVAIAKTGARATARSTARVGTAPKPPSGFAGAWSRTVTKEQAGGSGRPGRWTLTVNAVGWRILDASGHGALVDVAYLSSNTVEVRGGIATRNHDPREGNIWCDEPFQPVRYHAVAGGESLTLSLAGPKRCDGQSSVIAGDWTRG